MLIAITEILGIIVGSIAAVAGIMAIVNQFKRSR